MYQPKNNILKAYLENNEAKSAKIGNDEILISVEDVDEIIRRVEDRPTAKIIRESKDWFECDVTSCCGIGPITNENYCPKCGNKLIRS